MKKTKNLIVKSNQVIEAGYELSTSEQRLILSAIKQIPKNETISADELYMVTTRDYAEFGVHPNTAYRDLKDAMKRLYERSITIKYNGISTKIRWVQQVVFSDKDSINAFANLLGIQTDPTDFVEDESYSGVGIRFSTAILPFISNLKAEFTKYLASDLKGLSSTYAIRFYELIKQYESIGKRTIAITDLRFMFALEGKYPLFGNLQQRVIDPAIKEINENTPMEVQYSLRKTGRKYTHLDLTFKKKNVKEVSSKHARTKEVYEETKDIFIKMSDSQLDTFSSKLSVLPELGNMADIGASAEAFKYKLRDMLKDPKQQKILIPHLAKVGFKASN